MASPIQARNPELRKDQVTNRWVIFSPARAKRPSDFKSKSQANPDPNQICPFCIGQEHKCAPQIFRIPPENPDWKLRVIENLYPALSRNLEDQYSKSLSQNPDDSDALVSVLDGFGFHDVVIETPLHSIQLRDLAPEDIGEVLLAYRKRIEQLESVESVKYVQIFKNHGASAGASMTHSHSQMLSLPIIPANVSDRLNTMKEYFNLTGKCSICEIQTKDLLVNESTHFFAIVPYAATYPFELWIIPRNHISHFHHIDSDMAVDLGGLLKLLLKKMSVQLDHPPFNFMFHTSPLRAAQSELGYVHWYLQIVPQLTGIGGFELGSGCYINPVLPEDAALVLREVDVQI